MKLINKPLTHAVLVVLLLFSCFWSVTPAAAQDTPPSGTVAITATSVAAGVGVQWGNGILTVKGKKYPFSLQGLQIVGVGYAKVRAVGTVYGLQQLRDFEGVYAAAEVGGAAGSGPATVTMRNPNGVTLALHAIQKGVKLTLAAEGVNIKLQHAAHRRQRP